MYAFDPNHPAPDVLGTSTVPYSATTTYVWGDARTTPSISVSYRIALMDGQPTNYWVQLYAGVEFHNQVPSPYTFCQLTTGGMHDHGGQPVTGTVPYSCHTDAQMVDPPNRQGYPTAKVDFTVSNNIVAEAQSTVKTTGRVSLDNGYWEVNAGNKVGGSTAVAANSSVHMDALLRSGEGDDVVDKGRARVIFVYRILLDGVATPFWVEGTTQVFADTWHNAWCDFYDQNPVPANGQAAPSPAKFSPFKCPMDQYRPGPRPENWQTTYTISAAPITTVTAPIQLSELLQHCGDAPDDCDTSLSTVTRVPGPVSPNDQKSILNNQTDHDQTQKLTVSSTHSVTNTLGIKLASKVLIEVFEFSVELNYSIAITDSTTYTSETDVTAPPWTRVWLEQTPILVHVVGNVLMQKDGRYYLLPNIAANFPEKDGQSEKTIKSQPLPHSGAQLLTASGINAVVSTTDSAVSGQSVGLADGAFDMPADASGPITQASTPAARTLAPNGSTSWSTIEHQADPAVSGGAISQGSFSYRITQNKVPSPYWIKGAAVNGYNADGTRNTSATCQVYLGNPNTDGVPAAADAPYQCLTTVTAPNVQNIMDVAFSVGPRLAPLTPANPVTMPPAVGVPSSAVAPATTVAKASGLADTGSSVDATPFLFGILALLAGAGILITRRRRTRRG